MEIWGKRKSWNRNHPQVNKREFKQHLSGLEKTNKKRIEVQEMRGPVAVLTPASQS